MDPGHRSQRSLQIDTQRLIRGVDPLTLLEHRPAQVERRLIEVAKIDRHAKHLGEPDGEHHLLVQSRPRCLGKRVIADVEVAVRARAAAETAAVG